MNPDIAVFFSSHPSALPIFEELERRLRDLLPQMQLRVKATQISFFQRRMFGCVSFLPVRRRRALPDDYLTITFGLDHRVFSPRIEAATEPYPNRWTHHLVLSRPQEVDEELIGWLLEAAHFAVIK